MENRNEGLHGGHWSASKIGTCFSTLTGKGGLLPSPLLGTWGIILMELVSVVFCCCCFGMVVCLWQNLSSNSWCLGTHSMAQPGLNPCQFSCLLFRLLNSRIKAVRHHIQSTASPKSLKGVRGVAPGSFCVALLSPGSLLSTVDVLVFIRMS